jgi:hypothetical protein
MLDLLVPLAERGQPPLDGTSQLAAASTVAIDERQ